MAAITIGNEMRNMEPRTVPAARNTSALQAYFSDPGFYASAVKLLPPSNVIHVHIPAFQTNSIVMQTLPSYVRLCNGPAYGNIRCVRYLRVLWHTIAKHHAGAFVKLPTQKRCKSLAQIQFITQHFCVQLSQVYPRSSPTTTKDERQKTRYLPAPHPNTRSSRHSAHAQDYVLAVNSPVTPLLEAKRRYTNKLKGAILHITPAVPTAGLATRSDSLLLQAVNTKILPG
jgi:hypothetical protein